MAVVVRLTRVGRKGEARFRVVVKEKRSRRDGRAIETLGWYQKTQSSQKHAINKNRLSYWLAKGAKPSSAVAKLLGL